MRAIDADKLKERAIRVSTVKEHCYMKAVGTREIDKAPTLDVVSRGLFDQYKWERDVAIAQLAYLGIGFGEKPDGVYLSNEEYKELLKYRGMYEDLCR